MPLPERVRVKLISEEAGYISSAKVVERAFSMGELLEALVAVAGKDAARITQLLRGGSVAAGGYRHRWTPLDAEPEELKPLLDRFPDPQPERAFDPGRCVFASIRAGVETLELPREQAARHGFLRKESFWDVLMAVAAENHPAYQEYSYRDRADIYRFDPGRDAQERLRAAASLLRIERIEERLRRLPLERVTLWVNR